MPRPPLEGTTHLDPEIEAALAAMTGEELRAALRDALVRADDLAHARLADLIISNAARGDAGWRPAAPPASIVEEVRDFVAGSEESGVTEPSIVDAYLRSGMRAFLAGEHRVARDVLGPLLSGLADRSLDVDPDLWPQAALSVRLSDCFAQYLVTILTTTPAGDRVESFCEALEHVARIVPFAAPLASVEEAAMRSLPELEEILPLYLERLRSDEMDAEPGVSERAFWLHEAVLWVEGEEALARLTRRH